MSDLRPISLNAADVERDELEVDVLIVGAGVSGATAGLALLSNIAGEKNNPTRVLLIDRHGCR